MDNDKIRKLLSLGIMKDNNKSEAEVKDTFVKIFNKTIFRKELITVDDLEIPLLENWLIKVDKKYGYFIGYIMTVRNEKKELHYSFMLKDKSGNHITNVFSRNILEGFCKASIYLYEYIKEVK